MSTEPAPPTPTRSAAPGCGAYLLFALAALWALIASIIIQVVAWYVDQVLTISGYDVPSWIWVPISWGHALAVGVPVVLLAVFTQASRLKAAYTTWSVATLFILILSLSRAFPITWNQTAAVCQIALSLLFVAGLALFLRARHPLARGAGGRALALALAPLAALPLLLWGALGSPLDTVLNALAGLFLGLVAGLLLDTFFFQLLWKAGVRGRDVFFGAVVAAVTLAILGGGFGFGGSQLLLLVILPPLGLAVAGVARAAWPASAWQAIALLVGVVAAAALMFVDPDELQLVLGGDEILTWAFRAAWLSFFIALALGVVAAALAARRGRAPAEPAAQAGRPRSGGVLGGLAAVAWLVALLAYFVGGRPGFYGERFFVILKDQADVSQAYSIKDRNERLTYVYTTLVQHADTSQAGLRQTFDRFATGYQPFYLVNAIEVSGSPLLRAYVQLQPEVDRVLDSPHLRPLPKAPAVMTGAETQPPAQPEWNLTSIGADRVWSEFGVTGQGIVVGQSDSGVQGDHPALAGGYRGRDQGDDYNWYDPWNGSTKPTDFGGHGTHTLGSILGQGVGVAPGASWIGCVNLARNLANPAFYLDCMQFMLAPFPHGGDPLHSGDPTRAPQVLNNSWGCPPLEGCDAGSLGPAVRALRAAGIFVVASAGNEGPQCSSVKDPPALYREAFSVGAVDRDGNLAIFSSRGPVTVDGSGRLKPDISAPGVDVLSSLPDNTYGPESGTSMAGPHVVGAVVLLWSAQPSLIGDLDRTEQILRETARPYTGATNTANGPCDDGPAPNNGVGYGLLDVYAAVKAARSGP